MSNEEYIVHKCDLCESDDAAEIEVARHYTNNQALHVCKNCGFVYVRMRRSATRIAEAWSNEIYQSGYTARIPAVKARQTYVAEFIDTSIDLKGKTVCDIGGGEGQFLDMIEAEEYGAKTFAIEPSEHNCQLMTNSGISNFCGGIEDYQASEKFNETRFDVVTVMWTLENCQSCRTMLSAAHDVLKDGGYIALSTGSRLLVPFKKPLQYYLGPKPLDTHSFRVSANTLRGLLAVSGFEITHINRYIDTDYLVVVAKKVEKNTVIEWQKDDYKSVINFFDRWHEDTQNYYIDA